MAFDLQPALDSLGVHQHGIVRVEDIVFSEEVRKMCEANTCRKYGVTWACPPAVGTVDECKSRCFRLKNMLVFSGKYDLEDSYDFEAMMEGLASFKAMALRLEEALSPHIGAHFLLANEGCTNCEQCTYPDNPCRFPDKSPGSLEGYGIFVNELAASAGMNYINGANTVTYFGGLLFDGFAE
ncbi:MAG: DUF2284 domain-containing protein [Planctomycetota bacterium]|jgi:predicted metal-binding protein|nr:DUF2284 domain-containing protein [Planctomycetota bacterium]